MAKGPNQIGTEEMLDAMELAIVNDVDKLIEKKLSFEPKDKREIMFYISVKNRLSEDVIKAVQSRYINIGWSGMSLKTEGHTQFDSADDPYVYAVQLVA